MKHSDLGLHCLSRPFCQAHSYGNFRTSTTMVWFLKGCLIQQYRCICVNTHLKSSKKQLKLNARIPKSHSFERYAITCDVIAYHLVHFFSIWGIYKYQSGINSFYKPAGSKTPVLWIKYPWPVKYLGLWDLLFFPGWSSVRLLVSVLKILNKNQILTSIKGCNFVAKLWK